VVGRFLYVKKWHYPTQENLADLKCRLTANRGWRMARYLLSKSVSGLMIFLTRRRANNKTGFYGSPIKKKSKLGWRKLFGRAWVFSGNISIAASSRLSIISMNLDRFGSGSGLAYYVCKQEWAMRFSLSNYRLRLLRWYQYSIFVSIPRLSTSSWRPLTFFSWVPRAFDCFL